MIFRIIIFGWLLINIPIFGLVFAIGYIVYLSGYWFFYGAGLGAIVGWVYWALTIPAWRKWALKIGVSERDIEKYGTRFLLIWKKNNPLSKTEFELHNKQDDNLKDIKKDH